MALLIRLSGPSYLDRYLLIFLGLMMLRARRAYMIYGMSRYEGVHLNIYRAWVAAETFQGMRKIKTRISSPKYSGLSRY